MLTFDSVTLHPSPSPSPDHAPPAPCTTIHRIDVSPYHRTIFIAITARIAKPYPTVVDLVLHHAAAIQPAHGPSVIMHRASGVMRFDSAPLPPAYLRTVDRSIVAGVMSLRRTFECGTLALIC